MSIAHVLVVEDDEDNATSLSMLLRLYGHDVQVAVDGPSALQSLEVAQPDVVLLDLGLPKMDGWQVARQIRQHSPHRVSQRRLLIFAISGFADKESRLRSYEAGIDLHLVKPVDPGRLEDLLRRS